MSKNHSKFIEMISDNDTVVDINNNVLNKTLKYASMGRYGIYHILLSLKEKGLNNYMVMIPVYACNSIPYAVRKAGFEPVYYDIDDRDLNGSSRSIVELYEKTKATVLVLPSLYGNPADLVFAEKFCKEKEIYLIDDAAQAFGSSIEGRMVGSFGNAGLFSFSSGKPTLGHMGCYYWNENNDFEIERTFHRLYHRIAFINFYYNRYADYNGKKLFRFKILEYFRLFLYKVLDISNDDICTFEKKVLSNMYDMNLGQLNKIRNDFIMMIQNKWIDLSYRIITPIRGEGNNNKLVIVSVDDKSATELIKLLIRNDIRATRGYQLLDLNGEYPVAKKLRGKIVEVHYSTHNDSLNKIIKTLQNNMLIAK